MLDYLSSLLRGGTPGINPEAVPPNPYASESTGVQVDPRLKALRQKYMAEALKNKREQPEARMVGGRYVSPHWAERLSSVVDNVLDQGRAYNQAEADFETQQADENAAANWVKQRPTEQNVTIPEETLPENVQGPPRPAQDIRMAPSEQDMSNWIGEGMKRPLSRSLAAEVFKEHVAKKPERDAAREASWAALKEKGIQRLQEIEMRLEDKGLDRELRERLEAQGQQLKRDLAAGEERMRREIAAGYQQTSRDVAGIAAQSREEVARINAEAAKQRAVEAREARVAAAGQRPVPTPILKELNDSHHAYTGVRDSLLTFKPEYGGIGGTAKAVSGAYNPFAGKESKEAANWHKTYENQAALVERHKNFGTALSGSEQDAWKRATIGPWMDADVIRENLRTRANLARKVFNYDRDKYIKGGHKGVEAAYEEEPEIPALQEPGKPTTTTPTPVQGAAQTKTVGGKTYIKINGQWYQQ